MTLLPQHRDQPAGLEVQLTDGSWHRPEPCASPAASSPWNLSSVHGSQHLPCREHGSFLVNVGRLLKRWSNGAVRNTTHRVVDQGDASRISLPLFLHPNWEHEIRPVALSGDDKGEVVFLSITTGAFMEAWHGGEPGLAAVDPQLAKL